MGKVRVPKEHRPPTRFGVIRKICRASYPDAYGFRVKCYRVPRKGDAIWSTKFQEVIQAMRDFAPENPRVILEEVQP